MFRIVHYLNQFFGGMGGEEKAGATPRLVEGIVGPGRAIQNALGSSAGIVATIICGDNYFAENIDSASREVCDLLRSCKPDLLMAGPAFNAGRYGIACGAVGKAAAKAFGIPAVSGMHAQNPGVDLYRHEVYILSTQDSVRGMNAAVSSMSRVALALLNKEKIGRPDVEGYFPRGELVNEISDRTGAERVVSLLMKKLSGQPCESEVPRPNYNRIPPAPAINASNATIALVTDGGLVPRGNPDKIEARAATRFGKYDFSGKASLLAGEYEVSHVGYDSIFVLQDPNRLVPVDTMRQFEKEGKIGKLYETYFSTTGVANIVDTMESMGKEIVADLKSGGVSGVILTST